MESFLKKLEVIISEYTKRLKAHSNTSKQAFAKDRSISKPFFKPFFLSHNEKAEEYECRYEANEWYWTDNHLQHLELHYRKK